MAAASSTERAPIRILITGAAGQIGYSLLPLAAAGLVAGMDQPVILHLLDIAPAQKMLKGVVMELEDAAYPLLRGVVATTDLKEACTGVNVAFLVGGLPRKDGMTRKDLLEKNAPIFIDQGRALSDFADANCKVLVIANPANSNALVALQNGSRLPPQNFTCLTRLDQNRATAQLAMKLKTDPVKIRNAIIWGNHSATMFPDAAQATFVDADGKEALVSTVLDASYLRGPEFLKTVQDRGAAVISARGFSSALSAAKAAADHVRDWLLGTAPGTYASMGVLSDGSYGVAPGLVFSFPCVCTKGGDWTIKQGLVMDAYATEQLKATEAELVSEREAVLALQARVVEERKAKAAAEAAATTTTASTTTAAPAATEAKAAEARPAA